MRATKELQGPKGPNATQHMSVAEALHVPIEVVTNLVKHTNQAIALLETTSAGRELQTLLDVEIQQRECDASLLHRFCTTALSIDNTTLTAAVPQISKLASKITQISDSLHNTITICLNNLSQLADKLNRHGEINAAIAAELAEQPPCRELAIEKELLGKIQYELAERIVHIVRVRGKCTLLPFSTALDKFKAEAVERLHHLAQVATSPPIPVPGGSGGLLRHTSRRISSPIPLVNPNPVVAVVPDEQQPKQLEQQLPPTTDEMLTLAKSLNAVLAHVQQLGAVANIPAAADKEYNDDDNKTQHQRQQQADRAALRGDAAPSTDASDGPEPVALVETIVSDKASPVDDNDSPKGSEKENLDKSQSQPEPQDDLPMTQPTAADNDEERPPSIQNLVGSAPAALETGPLSNPFTAVAPSLVAFLSQRDSSSPASRKGVAAGGQGSGSKDRSGGRSGDISGVNPSPPIFKPLQQQQPSPPLPFASISPTIHKEQQQQQPPTTTCLKRSRQPSDNDNDDGFNPSQDKQEERNKQRRVCINDQPEYEDDGDQPGGSGGGSQPRTVIKKRDQQHQDGAVYPTQDLYVTPTLHNKPMVTLKTPAPLFQHGSSHPSSVYTRVAGAAKGATPLFISQPTGGLGATMPTCASAPHGVQQVPTTAHRLAHGSSKVRRNYGGLDETPFKGSNQVVSPIDSDKESPFFHCTQ